LHYGQACEGGTRIGLRLTHQELASSLGTTRVTITRFIGQLRDEGWLLMEPGRFLVVKAKAR
jgi:CRP-like cAMP-binding protein